MEYKTSEKEDNVIAALKNLGWIIDKVEFRNVSAIGPNCILHYRVSKLSPEQTLDITDYDTW